MVFWARSTQRDGFVFVREAREVWTVCVGEVR